MKDPWEYMSTNTNANKKKNKKDDKDHSDDEDIDSIENDDPLIVRLVQLN